MTTRAIANEIGPAARAAFSGTRVSWSNTIGMTLTEISMITVPVTVVVNSRRSSSNRAERRNWNSEEAITSLARRTGPPALSAAHWRPIVAASNVGGFSSAW